MYYADFKKELEKIGFKKDSKKSKTLFTKFISTYRLKSTTIEISWDIGGYIREVKTIKDGNEESCSSLKKCIQELKSCD